MKTISTLAASAAVTGLIVLPVRLEVACTVFLALGLVMLMRHDYRARPMLKLPARRANRWQAVFRAPTLRVQVEPNRLAA